MKLLVDAHALIWAADQPNKLSLIATASLQSLSNQIVVSAATIWEIAIKNGMGKLTLSQPYGIWMRKALTDLAATILPITIEYAEAQASLPRHHGDPFDRRSWHRLWSNPCPLSAWTLNSINTASAEFGDRFRQPM